MVRVGIKFGAIFLSNKTVHKEYQAFAEEYSKKLSEINRDFENEIGDLEYELFILMQPRPYMTNQLKENYHLRNGIYEMPNDIHIRYKNNICNSILIEEGSVTLGIHNTPTQKLENEQFLFNDFDNIDEEIKVLKTIDELFGDKINNHELDFVCEFS